MQYPQTRYQDTINPGISDTQTNLMAGVTPPTRTQGILTIGRLQANTEDVYFTGVAGNVVTLGIRGLSQTALTLTNVVGNQKIHAANESLEITNHHNYDTDLLRKSEDDTVTGNITFTQSVATAGLKDVNGKQTLLTPATTNAVNYVELDNSITGGNVVLKANGSDTNVNLELQGKGTGTPILADGSQTKTIAAPIVATGITNKQYVDSQIAINISGISSIYAPTQIPYGETITANSLVYLDDSVMKWKNITSSATTWYKKIGIAVDAGILNDTGKRVLLRGYLNGQSFANINPTFSSTGTGTINISNSAANTAVAIPIDNTTGAECITNAVTITASQNGTPTGPLLVYLVLANPDDGFVTPAAWDISATSITGTVLASGSIAQLSFSGVPQAFIVGWGANIKIPANSKAFVVLISGGGISASNFYILNGGGGVGSICTLSNASGKLWTTVATTTPTVTLSMVSQSPVGYSVKVYTGSPGSYGLAGSSLQYAWNRVVGYVLSATEMIFDPENVRPAISRGLTFNYTNAIYFLAKYTGLPYTPTSIQALVGMYNTATATAISIRTGFIGGDVTPTLSSVFSTANQNSGTAAAAPVLTAVNSASAQFVTPPASVGVNLITSAPLGLLTAGGPANTHTLAAIRLEDGVYLYHGFTGGSLYLGSASGSTGFASSVQMIFN